MVVVLNSIVVKERFLWKGEVSGLFSGSKIFLGTKVLELVVGNSFLVCKHRAYELFDRISKFHFAYILPAILYVTNSAIFDYGIDIKLVCAECAGGVHRAPTRG